MGAFASNSQVIQTVLTYSHLLRSKTKQKFVTAYSYMYLSPKIKTNFLISPPLL